MSQRSVASLLIIVIILMLQCRLFVGSFLKEGRYGELVEVGDNTGTASRPGESLVRPTQKIPFGDRACCTASHVLPLHFHYYLHPVLVIYLSVPHNRISIMFRSSLIRQQRALARSLSRTAQPQRYAFSSFPTAPLRTSIAIPQRLGRRWQSTEADKKSEEAAKPAEDAAKTEEDPIKKELEAKSKEVVDLKVRHLA